jgi:hypothetical protein
VQNHFDVKAVDHLETKSPLVMSWSRRRNEEEEKAEKKNKIKKKKKKKNDEYLYVCLTKCVRPSLSV